MPSISVQAPSVTTIIGTVTIGNFPASQAVTFSAVSISNLPATQAVSLASVPTHGVTLASTTVTVSSLPAISGTVTANVPNIQVCTQGNYAQTSAIQTALGVINENNNSQVLAVFGGEAVEGEGASAFVQVRNQISGTVTIGSAIPTGTNSIGVVTIGGGTVTLGASTAQIGSVTASISGTVPVSGTFWQATQPVSGTFFQATQPVSLASTTVTVSSLPALAAGTAQIGFVTASISNSVVTFYPLQGTTVTNTNFTSTNPSTALVSTVANREVLTVFNEGAGNLHISAGGICTTTAYQVRLSPGDYWECPAGQLSLAHTAVLSTAGTARVTEVS
jgi:hypothetical protein